MNKKKQLYENQILSFSRRSFILGLSQFAMISVIVGRLFQIQVKESENYSVLSDKNRFDIYLVAPSRGNIYDRKGRMLTANAASFDIEIVPEWAADLRQALNNLSKYIILSESEIESVILKSKNQQRFLPIIVKSNLDRQTVSRVAVFSPHLSGVKIKQNERRIFPQGSIAVHTTGYVGLVSKSELDPSFPELSLPGFRIGKTGIEFQFDHLMRGLPGKKRVEVNALGKEIRSDLEKDTHPGKDINLSIDIGLQTIALRRLQAGNDDLISINQPEVQNIINNDRIFAKQLIEDRDVVNKNLKNKFVLPESGSVVVMDVNTGEIIISVSSPGYDPNKFDPGISASDWELLSTHPRSPLVDKSISGQYPPGSTFKMIVALAALEAGIISKKTKFICKGFLEIGDMKFHCWRHKYGHGSVNVFKAIAESCDVFFYQLALKTGINRIAETARKFGLGSVTGVDLPGERSGLIPDREWKQRVKGKSWRPGETIIAGIGQGYVLATPMQLALMTSRIANGGKKINPKLLTNQKNDTFLEDIDVNDNNLRIIQKAMEQVTLSDRGTGRNFRLNLKNIEMAGKTGTVQVRRISTQERESSEGVIKNEDRPWPWRDHALYVGYAPMDSPKYSICVVVEHGGSGSIKAGPIAKDIMEAVLVENPTRLIPNNPKSRPKV